jgi:hypothetical protein
MRLGVRITAALLAVMLLAGCAAHTHVVGGGAKGMQTSEARQWYILWGLVPINDVDTAAMAGGADDYTVHTEQSVIDVLIGIVATYVTITSRTVTVTK